MVKNFCAMRAPFFLDDTLRCATAQYEAAISNAGVRKTGPEAKEVPVPKLSSLLKRAVEEEDSDFQGGYFLGHWRDTEGQKLRYRQN
jgi:hypothetical protein